MHVCVAVLLDEFDGLEGFEVLVGYFDSFSAVSGASQGVRNSETRRRKTGSLSPDMVEFICTLLFGVVEVVVLTKCPDS